MPTDHLVVETLMSQLTHQLLPGLTATIWDLVINESKNAPQRGEKVVFLVKNLFSSLVVFAAVSLVAKSRIFN